MSREQTEYIKKMLSYTSEITQLIAKMTAPASASNLYGVGRSVGRAIQIARELLTMDGLPGDARDMLSTNLAGLVAFQKQHAIGQELVQPPKNSLMSGIYRKVVNSGTIAALDLCFTYDPNCYFPQRDIETGKVLGYHYATHTEIGNGKGGVTLVWRSLPVKPEDIEKHKQSGIIEPPKIRQEAMDLHFYIRGKYMEYNSRAFTFTLQEYMKARGLKDTPRSRERAAGKVARACEMLKQTELYIDGVNGWGRLYVSSYYYNNIIYVSLSDEMVGIFTKARGQHAWLPDAHLISIDKARHPHLPTLMLLLSQYKAMNHRKPMHGDLIHMRDILSKLQKLAAYQEARLTYSEYRRAVIDPLERDLSFSKEVWSWEYAKGNNASQDEFDNSDIMVSWNNHPQDSEEFKAELAAKAMRHLIATADKIKAGKLEIRKKKLQRAKRTGTKK